ncbi:MAG: PaaI family thioesterase [Treponema sp.]|nr:PaaI family thioesterase [Treponema sp.]
MTDLEKARDFFYKDTFASKQTGIVIENVADHYAKCSLTITENHRNAYGGLMGGVIFTLADFTFAVSSNFNQPLTVSINSQINFTGMPKGKQLLSESKLIKDGKSTCLYEINITDELQTQVAFVTITGMKLNNR